MNGSLPHRLSNGEAIGIPKGVRNREQRNGQDNQRPYKPPFQRRFFMSHFHDANVLSIGEDGYITLVIRKSNMRWLRNLTSGEITSPHPNQIW